MALTIEKLHIALEKLSEPRGTGPGLPYAGIGARTTPGHILAKMEDSAQYLSYLNYQLRTGGAQGADEAFMNGAKHMDVIYPPEGGLHKEWHAVAKTFHPSWDSCSDFAKNAHARNAAIILGRNLDHPVEFVLCWTSRGRFIGGTGLSMRIAKAHNIPIYNFGGRW